jgi:SPP1 family predicted phage head-tail adaptor
MIGKMRQRVTLQKPVETTDAGGGRSITWTDVETVWAGFRPLSGRETIHAMGLANPVSHRVEIRHRTDIEPSWRLSYDGRLFSIQSVVDPDERKKTLRLMVQEGLPV